MEKQINDFSILTTYQKRQVIINYYLDGDLLEQRNGFHFQTIHISNTLISFTRTDKEPFTISIKEDSSFYVNDEFQNYYILRNGFDKIEIYFP